VPAKVDGSAAHRMMVMSDLNIRLAAVVPARAPSNFSVIEGVPA